MNKECLFCKIINNEEESYLIYEDEHVYVFLDIFPKAKGHTLVIPKAHSKDFVDLSLKESPNLFKTTQKVALAIQQAFNPGGIIIRSNIGKPAGQVIFHTHFHVLPVYEHEVAEMSFEEVSKQIKKFL